METSRTVDGKNLQDPGMTLVTCCALTRKASFVGYQAQRNASKKDAMGLEGMVNEDLVVARDISLSHISQPRVEISSVPTKGMAPVKDAPSHYATR
jgi:hypothetical protein